MDNLRRFKKVKIALMRSKMFVGLSGIMMLGKTVLDDTAPTAMTNGRDEWYNPEFIFRFGDKGSGFIIVHENMHKAARHMVIYTKLHAIDPHLTNAACDYWINGRIRATDPTESLVAMPRDENGNLMGLYDPKYEGWTVLRIFNELREKGEGQPESGFDDHDWEGAAQLTEEEKKKLEGDIKQAIQQGQMAAKKAGAGGGADKLGLGELLRSKVDWRAQLQEFVSSVCADKQESSWRRPSRRYLYQDMIMPTMVSESIKELVLARDASGSMFYKTRLLKVTSEMVAITSMLHIDRIHLIDWDGVVGRHEVLTSDQMNTAEEVKAVTGGGGTDPSCVSTYIKEKGIKPDAVIMLTDGEVPNWGEWSCPVLWVIANREVMSAPVGKTINLGEED
jgi:predicted metal-dependent peptidase